MRILPEAFTPYLSEITSQPLADRGMAEPVGDSARLDNALPQSLTNPQATAREDRARLASAKREQRKGKLGEQASGKERRKNDRRKEERPVLLDTRMSANRRKPPGYASIDFEI
jgi:hypothetical protein